ncbi:MAG: amidohydrolase [Spirochaetes bacterium]|nr:amidohydrolase [Spirochaetota bacterium]
MVIDSHLHLIRKKNFDADTYNQLNMVLPEDTALEDLVGWLKEAGVKKAVVMGQDMTRIWKTNFGEQYVVEALKRYPDFFVGLASVEPIDVYNRFNQKAYDYFTNAVATHKFKGLLLTPPYGQYYSNDKTVYPFYEKALEYNIVVQFHHSAGMGPAILAPTKYADPYKLNDVLVDFPDLKIVSEHLGYPWSEHLFLLMANAENLWTDLAMLYDRPVQLAWNLVLAKEYGVIGKVMYASDYVAPNIDLFSDNPADDFKKWIVFIKEGLNKICDRCGWPLFSEEELEGILWKNANRLYELV